MEAGVSPSLPPAAPYRQSDVREVRPDLRELRSCLSDVAVHDSDVTPELGPQVADGRAKLGPQFTDAPPELGPHVAELGPQFSDAPLVLDPQVSDRPVELDSKLGPHVGDGHFQRVEPSVDRLEATEADRPGDEGPPIRSTAFTRVCAMSTDMNPPYLAGEDVAMLAERG